MHRDPEGCDTTWVQVLGGSSPPGTHGLSAPPAQHGWEQWAQELWGRERLAPNLVRVCLIPDNEATPGTWLANGCSPDNGTRRHALRHRLLALQQHRAGISWAHGSLWPPTLLWHGTAHHGMDGRAWHGVSEAAGTWAEPGQMGMQCMEKQGAPSFVNTGRIYTRASSPQPNPPAQAALE